MRTLKFIGCGVLLIGLILLAITCGEDGEDVVFSDATLQGVWLVIPAGNSVILYFEADSIGNVTDYSFFNRPPSGSYEVKSNGAVTITIHQGLVDEFTLFGELITTTSGMLNDDAMMLKVSDHALMEGVWTGTLTETCDMTIDDEVCDDTVYTASLEFGESGMLVTGGLTDIPHGGVEIIAAQNGMAYSEDTAVAMLLVTDHEEAYGMIQLGGELSGDTLTGFYRPDFDSDLPAGVIELTRQP